MHVSIVNIVLNPVMSRKEICSCDMTVWCLSLSFSKSSAVLQRHFKQPCELQEKLRSVYEYESTSGK